MIKIDKTFIKGSTLTIVCSGIFGIGSEGTPSAQLIRNEIVSFLNNKDLKVTYIEIDFRRVKYEWGDGPLSAIMSIMDSDLHIKYLASKENFQSLFTLFKQSGMQNLFNIKIEIV
jgi:hypothetical protein